MQLSFIYRDDISVRGKLDGPLLHMLNELRKEVGISSSVLWRSITYLHFARDMFKFVTWPNMAQLKVRNTSDIF